MRNRSGTRCWLYGKLGKTAPHTPRNNRYPADSIHHAGQTLTPDETRILKFYLYWFGGRFSSQIRLIGFRLFGLQCMLAYHNSATEECVKTASRLMRSPTHKLKLQFNCLDRSSALGLAAWYHVEVLMRELDRFTDQ